MSATLRTQQILAALIAPSAEQERLPDRLCRLCAQDMQLDGAAMLLVSSDNFSQLIGATSGMATAMEDLQFELGEGPSIAALRHERPVLCPDLAGWTMAWPVFGPAAGDAGVLAMFAFPVVIGGTTVGVLSCYRNTPGPLPAAARTEAAAYAHAAAAMLLHLLALSPADQEELHPQLSGPPGRADIHVAVGMVSEQAKVAPEHALLLLRARAFAAGTSIVQLSREVLAGNIHWDRDF